MANAYECDRCKVLVKSAVNEDLFYPIGFRVEVKYLKRGRMLTDEGKAISSYNCADICFACRIELLKEIVNGVEAKQKYTWQDLKGNANPN